ncbi:uncharacterized protein K452DRAFT_292951 [Aplosporella prunicola CBS 121167]|uniref:Wbp11/ELF5/Saf1 N-terminal domain-containing protein n=1 Tax=Aplosporella prunicola CBS 121167 TaxID=1176127 RepID=A0A6A6AYA4_9PEZI|nr:uncharacterized protein K452DRAFT_292951 [Aplosporella prunicola CBS 121167]KAF2135757.1 hypothetical protein K452DRAFT_292951 [Aplosporella prunicola CBS 121167]
MAKEKSINPAAAQHKADKARALKKSKAAVASQRNERLAKRNPERLQRQIDDLKEAEQAGSLRPRDRETLNQLEKDVRAIRKAREELGDRAPQFGGYGGGRERGEGGRGGRGGGRGRGGGILGKRRRDGAAGDNDEDGESSASDDEARHIPMPRDTPPPIPRKQHHRGAAVQAEASDAPKGPHPLPSKPAPAVPVQTVYESAPVIRDLRKEATSRFVPAAVARKTAAAKGQRPGQLLEPEELDRLEKQGYGGEQKERNQQLVQDSRAEAEEAVEAAVEEAEFKMMNAEAQAGDLDEEEKRFERELRNVEMEEVEDEEFGQGG